MSCRVCGNMPGLYIAFGHDEETGGKRGAKMVGKWLAEQGVVLDVVIDEVRFFFLFPSMCRSISLLRGDS